MSEHREAILDTPLVRLELDKQIKMLRPAGIENRIVSPPVQEDLRTILANPLLAEQLWHQVDPLATPAPEPVPEQRPVDAEAIVQVGLALYVLQGLHTPDKPGFEHLERSKRAAQDDDAEPGVQPI